MVFLLRLCALLLALILPAAAYAAAPLLIFSENAQDIRTRSLAGFLLENSYLSSDAPYQTASADLNDDGIEEIVFRQGVSACEIRADCSYVIAGLTAAKQPVVIASIRARKIGIADEKAYGVRKLFVYNSQHNDFAYEILAWNPRHAAFGPQ